MQGTHWRKIMISKLKTRFILLSMAALLTLLVVIIAVMNIINYTTVVQEADNVLSMLSNNEGKFPESFGVDKEKFDKRPLSPEIPFESRFFSIQFDNSMNVVFTDIGQIASVDKQEALNYGKNALKKTKEVGFINNFRYIKKQDDRGVRITFLDCGRKLDAFNSFLVTSLLVSLMGYLIITVFIIFFAGKITKPIAESYNKQKRFITDASHEIKTPLTIIGANVDVLEMELGENEGLKDIKQQTERLTDLTNDLVYLSRMEEVEKPINMIDFPVSDLVYETAHSFLTLAEAENKDIVMNIEPMLTMKGDFKSIEKLVSILMNNAIKYSPIESKILLNLSSKGKQLFLSIENQTIHPVKKEKLEYIFDRFYRSDESRNSETGGHGIGLSMAKAIVAAHNGKVFAWTNEEYSFGITAIFSI